MSNGRISVLRKGAFQPLYAIGPTVPSPSPTLLVEAQRIAAGETCTRMFTSHVLTFFPEGASVLHGGEGRGTHRVEIPRGAVVLSLRSQVESVEWTAAASQLSVQIDDRALAVASEALSGGATIELVPSPGMVDPRLGGLFGALNAERQAGYPSGHLFVDGVEQAMTSYLVGHARGGAGNAAPRHFGGGLAPGVARRLVEYMQDNIAAEFSMSELAVVASLSTSHLARAFRVTFRMTPYKFLLGLRITHAKTLLLQRDGSVLDVAQRAGFKTQQHFSRVFSQGVGVSPGRFRREG